MLVKVKYEIKGSPGEMEFEMVSGVGETKEQKIGQALLRAPREISIKTKTAESLIEIESIAIPGVING